MRLPALVALRTLRNQRLASLGSVLQVHPSVPVDCVAGTWSAFHPQAGSTSLLVQHAWASPAFLVELDPAF